jgi:hypothetical protein
MLKPETESIYFTSLCVTDRKFDTMQHWGGLSLRQIACQIWDSGPGLQIPQPLMVWTGKRNKNQSLQPPVTTWQARAPAHLHLVLFTLLS